MPLGDQLIGKAGVTSGDLVSLDVRSGAAWWRRPGALRVMVADVVAVVGGVLGVTNSIDNQLVGFSVDSGRPVATVVRPARRGFGCPGPGWKSAHRR